eukprot:9974223-Karenia_brevis.AAC.1
MAGVARNMEIFALKRFAATVRQLLHEQNGSDILVLPVCKRERHRIIATKELLYTYLQANKDKYRKKVESGPTPTYPS